MERLRGPKEQVSVVLKVSVDERFWGNTRVLELRSVNYSRLRRGSSCSCSAVVSKLISYRTMVCDESLAMKRLTIVLMGVTCLSPSWRGWEK